MATLFTVYTRYIDAPVVLQEKNTFTVKTVNYSVIFFILCGEFLSLCIYFYKIKIVKVNTFVYERIYIQAIIKK